MNKIGLAVEKAPDEQQPRRSLRVVVVPLPTTYKDVVSIYSAGSQELSTVSTGVNKIKKLIN